MICICVLNCFHCLNMNTILVGCLDIKKRNIRPCTTLAYKQGININIYRFQFIDWATIWIRVDFICILVQYFITEFFREIFHPEPCKLVQMVLIISFDDQPPIVPTIWLITDQIWCSCIYPFWLQNLSACEQKCKFVLGHYEVLFFKYFIFVRNSIGFAKMV